MPDARALGLLTYDPEHEHTLLYVEPGDTWVYRATGAREPEPGAGGAGEPTSGSGAAGTPSIGSGGEGPDETESGGAPAAAGNESGGETSITGRAKSDDAGCSCRTTTTHESPGAHAVSGLILALLAARRRRRETSFVSGKVLRLPARARRLT
jgi:MYXO-CTERM domain-containing protein